MAIRRFFALVLACFTAAALKAAPAVPVGAAAPVAGYAAGAALAGGHAQIGVTPGTVLAALAAPDFAPPAPAPAAVPAVQVPQAAPQVPAGVPAAPRAPPGVRSVSVDTVRAAVDVERLIPNGANSNGLKARLKRDVSRMAPYQIYTYNDSLGGRFTGIDLSAKPALADQIPELQPHEVRLIKKLQLVDGDIRVLVREDGKTPDLAVGDRLVEMKSFAGENLPLEALIDKANVQIREHARRHGLGHGAAAVDLTAEAAVPAARVQGMLDAWQAGAGAVVLDQVIVFARDDMKVFVRREDGTYRPADLRAAFAPAVQERPVARAELPRVRALLKKGGRAGS